jgi:nicotinamide-nucleotide amidase
MNISKQVVGYLKSRGLVLVSVETCTAGHLAAMLADAAGETTCLDLGLIVHASAALATLPGVRAETLARSGAISEAVAREIAEGVLAQRAGYAHVAVVSLGVLPGSQAAHAASVSVAQYFARACTHNGLVHSAAETTFVSGNRNEMRRDVVRRALLGVPRFVDSVIGDADGSVGS